jgi:hypothetical protein
LIILIASLFSFEDEAPSFVEVYASGTVRAIAVMESDRLFKYVCVLIFVNFGWFGPGDI